MPAEDGDETLVHDYPGSLWGYWVLRPDGIFYLAEEGKPSGVPGYVEFLSFATGKRRRVASLEKVPFPGAPGMTVSADGKTLLYVQVDHETSDIMLVENFR